MFSSHSCYSWGSWVSLSACNSYYFLDNWVSLDQICALLLLLLIFFYYPEVIVIILQQLGKRDRIEHILLDFMGQFIIFFWREGAKIAYFGANWKFSLCTHILRIFRPNPRLGPSLHVLLLRFNHVVFFFHEMKELGTTTWLNLKKGK